MGKKASDPQRAEVKRLQVQLTEACKQKAVGRVLEVFKEWESAEVVLAPNCFAQALSVLAACEGGADNGEPGRTECFGHAKRIFARALTDVRDWRGVGESIYTLMVRLASRAGEPLLAMQYLEQMRRPPVSIRPKLRTFIPILEACAGRGLTDEAEALYRNEIFSTCRPAEDTAIWTTDDEDRLWQCVFALRLRALSHALGSREDGAAPRLAGDGMRRLEAILDDLKAVCPQLRADTGLPEALQEAFGVLGWRLEQAQIGEDARCPLTNTVLRAMHCSKEDFRGLLSLVERLAIEDASPKGLDSWRDFKAWLARTGHEWDTVIDGANVGHHNQNFAQGAFSHAQIGEVIEQCKQAGRRRVGLVLRERWLQPELDMSVPSSKRKKRRLPQLGRQEAAAEALLDPAAAVVAAAASAGEPAAAATPGGAPAASEEEPRPHREGEPRSAAEAAEAVPDEEMSEAQRQIVGLAEEWRRSGVLVVSPPSIDDDWVAMYLAVAMCLRGVSDVQLVTNDEFRDHFWRMRQPTAFRTWRERHLTRYHVLSERPEPGDGMEDEYRPPQIQSAQLFPPPLYSCCIQRSLDGRCWHFPVRPVDVPAQGDEAMRLASSGFVKGTDWFVAWDPRATTKGGAG
mmetsp:Transcript_25009/g.77795  ORF Transcript_25009/g.77795 Transcript_25009/m.77795 type:complete len:628 (+) Transcript_25009:59-1942(+)|eukprot:CAMPEP_0204597498 /NCGR_PEP_ID=MMETSP0661-20131031/53842_1 /ASSEMBLY_ACC=CAM_ASM_000606 /TAXON_ID=109239 /ORGANISM="Alexandrium margalefi, Strain AMGDE01CS-322" /LENGTH=627 /DNA_ID=CAMNT_0051608195 /DNA_START=59 /DNA_END=1942 /DNA_ORIENTATION=-